MDDKVNDFLNEINEITPPTKPAQEGAWKQCFDELTGYAYYWNKKTDKVTWEPPEGFKKTVNSPVSKKKQFIPTKVEPLFPGVDSSSKVAMQDIKIYSIGENSKKLLPPKAPTTKVSTNKPVKKIKRRGSDSEDEKITLISSYGTDSESEEDYHEVKEHKTDEKLPNRISQNPNSDEDNDDYDILAKIQKRAQELQALGGDIPAEVKDTVENSKTELLNTTKPIPGVSLVAGYSDSDEENEEIRTVGIKMMEPKEKPHISHSTLFPIAKPININDFKSSQIVGKNTNHTSTTSAEVSENFDSKPFQRKRRIGVALINTGKRKIESDANEEGLRKGLGFEKTNDNVYQGLKKDGIAFVKSETLNPVVSATNIQENSVANLVVEDTKSLEMVKETYSTLKEKLTFLNEGRPDISPVHLMLIQAETLFLAMKDGALKLSYLQKWLKETYSELIKLEKEATPAGWKLQWDKSNKRYFYQNLNTGESQWEYPQPEFTTNDDAMDISTTPPPFDDESNIAMSPPLPPTISTPPPPPPPIISSVEEVECIDVPLPEQPKLRKLADGSAQPLPPGVDTHEVTDFSETKENSEGVETLNSALDSFYSDIAAISASPPQEPTILPPHEETLLESHIADIKTDVAKKKKKLKVKLGPGLAMKKKGVSQLVEKWKSVQQEY